MSARTFDRTRDVAKLVGCNTRNVEYRWSIFDKHLRRIPRGSAVLDFGAGSLRESYELIRMGFSVTAIDNNAETLRSYYADYAWPRDPEIIVGTDLRAVKARKFALITAFDVFEHLYEPEVMLAQMRELMADGALIFCTVPNRRSIFEIAWRVNWKMGLAMGRTFAPGEPHIQFKSPREWRSFFENCGFRILDHEMAIGFFVNTWAALVDVPAGVLRKLRRAIGLGVDSAPSVFLAGPRVMAVLDAVDKRTRLHALYGWNLLVLSAGKA